MVDISLVAKVFLNCVIDNSFIVVIFAIVAIAIIFVVAIVVMFVVVIVDIVVGEVVSVINLKLSTVIAIFTGVVSSTLEVLPYLKVPLAVSVVLE